MTDFRLCFSKKGPLVYISHLDLTHTFIRAMNRARLPLRYSEGFNPHPKLTFALPLSVGMAGENELCDVGLCADLSAEEFAARLSKELPAYIELKSVSEKIGKLRNVMSADYAVLIADCYGVGEKIREILSREEIIVRKKTKSGEKDVNIKPQIFSFSSEEVDGGTLLHLNVDASPDGGYLNPDYVLRVLSEARLFEPNVCSVTREKIYVKT